MSGRGEDRTTPERPTSSTGASSASPPGAPGRRIVYCLVPPDLAPKLHELLRNHFREDPGVEVVVERRRRERRAGADDRRAAEAGPPGAGERRAIRNVAGRRVGDRRAELSPVASPPELPRRARRYAERLRFVERLAPPSERAEDLDSARLVTRFQAGDSDAFATLYTRYFDRVYSYLKLLLRDPHESEDAAQQVFADAFEHLARYELRGKPFKAWLFTVARHRAIAVLRQTGRIEPMDPSELAERREREAAAEQADSLALTWITDVDLTILIERLPQVQRQVLTLRFLLDLRVEEIAEVLNLSPNHVSVLQYRALNFLRKRLEALGRTPERRTPDARMKAPLKHNRVARNRRNALSP